MKRTLNPILKEYVWRNFTSGWVYGKILSVKEGKVSYKIVKKSDDISLDIGYNTFFHPKDCEKENYRFLTEDEYFLEMI